MNTKRWAALVSLAMLALGTPANAAAPAFPDPTPPKPPGDFDGATSNDGSDIWKNGDFKNLPGGGNNGGDSASPVISKPMEYGTSLACHNTGPYVNTEAEPACTAGYADPCLANPALGPGPATAIWSRELDPATGKPLTTTWTRLGTTCLPDAIPTGARLPLSMVVDAFHRTAWAKATVSTQPKGNSTLVGLKTFYKANWQAAGFQPGEVDSIPPAQMLGFRVDVRPNLGNFVYHFGDGTNSGPTSSPGGVYPDGDVVHTYKRPGTYNTYVAVTFGAEYRINGGAWQPLPGTATVTMPGTTVTVREARGVLVNE